MSFVKLARGPYLENVRGVDERLYVVYHIVYHDGDFAADIPDHVNRRFLLGRQRGQSGADRGDSVRENPRG